MYIVQIERYALPAFLSSSCLFPTSTDLSDRGGGSADIRLGGHGERSDVEAKQPTDPKDHETVHRDRNCREVHHRQADREDVGDHTRLFS